MKHAAAPCRTYIVYHHGLFAQGVRSILEDGSTAQIVGMESDVAKAMDAVQALQPEVIIMEECAGKHQPMHLGAFLHSATDGRVVTLSLDDAYATVYDRRRLTVTDAGDLVKAIRRVGKPNIPRPDQPDPKASMLFQSGSGRNGGEGRSGKESRVRRTRKEEVTKTQDTPRASRTRKGE